MIDCLTEDQSRLLDHNETINHFCEISNATRHPCFNPHKYLFGVNTGHAEDSYKSELFVYNIWHKPNHSARILWNATRTEINNGETLTTTMDTELASSNKAIRFRDRSPYWHYPKVGYQLAGVYEPDFRWMRGGSTPTPVGPTHAIMDDYTTGGDSFPGGRMYFDNPTEFGLSQWIFYDMMWLYRWTKFSPASYNWTNKGQVMGMQGTRLTPKRPGVGEETLNYGFTSYTHRPWGYVDNGIGATKDEWSIASGHGHSGQYKSNWETTDLINPPGPPFEDDLWNWQIGGYGVNGGWFHHQDQGSHLSARAWPSRFSETAWATYRDNHFDHPTYTAIVGSYNDGVPYALGPHDGTRVRFDVHQFIGEYNASNNQGGALREVRDSSVDPGSKYWLVNTQYDRITMGHGIGWTGLMNWNNWFSTDMCSTYRTNDSSADYIYWDTREPFYDSGYQMDPVSLPASYAVEGLTAIPNFNWNVHDNLSASRATSAAEGVVNRARMMNNLGPREFPKMHDTFTSTIPGRQSGHANPQSDGWAITQMESPKVAYPRFPLVRLPSNKGYAGILMSFEGSFGSIFGGGIQTFKSDNWEENTHTYNPGNYHNGIDGDMIRGSDRYTHWDYDEDANDGDGAWVSDGTFYPLAHGEPNDDTAMQDVGKFSFGVPSNNRWWGVSKDDDTANSARSRYGWCVGGWHPEAETYWSAASNVITLKFPDGSDYTNGGFPSGDDYDVVDGKWWYAKTFSQTNNSLARFSYAISEGEYREAMDDENARLLPNSNALAGTFGAMRNSNIWVNNSHCHNVHTAEAHPNEHNWYFPQKAINPRQWKDRQNQVLDPEVTPDSPDESPTGTVLLIN